MITICDQSVITWVNNCDQPVITRVNNCNLPVIRKVNNCDLPVIRRVNNCDLPVIRRVINETIFFCVGRAQLLHAVYELTFLQPELPTGQIELILYLILPSIETLCYYGIQFNSGWWKHSAVALF